VKGARRDEDVSDIPRRFGRGDDARDNAGGEGLRSRMNALLMWSRGGLLTFAETFGLAPYLEDAAT
jgi:hypothetical protein